MGPQLLQNRLGTVVEHHFQQPSVTPNENFTVTLVLTLNLQPASLSLHFKGNFSRWTWLIPGCLHFGLYWS